MLRLFLCVTPQFLIQPEPAKGCKNYPDAKKTVQELRCVDDKVKACHPKVFANALCPNLKAPGAAFKLPQHFMRCGIVFQNFYAQLFHRL